MPSTFGQLREILLNEFTEPEVKMLCDKMGVDFEHLAGTGLFGKTRELLFVVQQQERLPQLAAHMRAIHPYAFAEQELPDTDNSQTGQLTDEIDQTDKTTSSHNVARETELSYVVTPQARLPFLIALIATIFIFGALIVFLPALLNQNSGTSPENQGTSTTSTPATMPATTASVVSIRDGIPTASAPQPTSNINAVGVIVVSTPAPISSIPVISNEITTPAQLPKPTVRANTVHPAAQAVKDANAILPSLYRGEVTAEAIQTYWSNDAYQVTISWNEKLPTVMKLQQAPRTSLVISYHIVGPPAVTPNPGGNYTVTTREYWGYFNPRANIALCDTRDYVYSVREVNGKYVVLAVTSKILDKLCR